jgi:HEAT repeat protein
VALLVWALNVKYYDVRVNAAIELGKLGPVAAPAVPTLVPLLKDPGEELRYQAATALGNIGPDAKDAINKLIATKRDKSARVADAADLAVTKIQKK